MLEKAVVLASMMSFSAWATMADASANRKFETRYGGGEHGGYFTQADCSRDGNQYKMMAMPSTGVSIVFKCKRFIQTDWWKLKLEVQSIEGSGVDAEETGSSLIKAGSDVEYKFDDSCLKAVNDLAAMMDGVKGGSIYAKCEGPILKTLFEFKK